MSPAPSRRRFIVLPLVVFAVALPGVLRQLGAPDAAWRPLLLVLAGAVLVAAAGASAWARARS